jgi:hypothetical protein
VQQVRIVLFWRHNEREVIIQFTDGTRLFINAPGVALELSITGSG